MAIWLNKKNKAELPTALGRSRNVLCPLLPTLALAALIPASFAQEGARGHARLPYRQAQSGVTPYASPHTGATQNPVKAEPHGTTPATGSRNHPTAGSQMYIHPSPAARGANGRLPAPGTAGGARIERRVSSGHRVLETTQTMPGKGTLHAVRYGNGLTGVVEHPMKSGYLSRTYVRGGRVLYARVFRRNTFQRFGHSFSYESLVPGIAFGTAYYAWAVHPWGTPVIYRWRWEAEPWHRAYGGDFTPYAQYTSLDEWLTDYVIAQNLRSEYQNWQAENAPQPPATASPPAPTGSTSSESSNPGQRPYWEGEPDNRRPYWEEDSDQDTAAQPKSPKKSDPGPNSRAGSQSQPSAEDSPPPLPGAIKAELNAQIKRQLVERQTPATTSATEDLPDSLKPGHTLFRVNSPLDVPAKVSGQTCSLRANDYIERTGDMDSDGMVPVKVKVGGVSDCAIGLNPNVSVNDLEAMDSEQQQALTDALLAASRNMGSSGGLPQAPETTPLLLAAGQTRPAPDAMSTLSQLQ